MAQFELVATGGTFDIIHMGHKSLLAKAFEISDMVIIGLTSDEMAGRKGKNIINGYVQRSHVLAKFITEHFDSNFQISKLEDDFGPAVLQERVQALVVSEETQNRGAALNLLRAKRGILPVQIILVPMSLAKDGIRISTTRIRNSEIDMDGNLLSMEK